jgi:hypothetical protein
LNTKNKLKKFGLRAVNVAKRTPNHPQKSHIVLAKVGGKEKVIRFGQQGVKGVKSPRTEAERKRQRAFKSRHSKNIKRGKMSAAWWSDKVKWSP